MGWEVREIKAGQTEAAFPAMALLRPRLTEVSEFVRLVDEVQRPEGYRLVGAFDGQRPEAVAVAGFRVLHALAFGRFLYVDDLSTLPEARGHGHGRRLLEWLDAEAVRLGCEQVHLDSGVGPDRAAAHRLYMNAHMPIVAYHFAKPVGV